MTTPLKAVPALHTATPDSPLAAVTAVTRSPELPTGTGDRFTGFGIMGLPMSQGHYLALRDFPATTFAPAYQSVWHRSPNGVWTFYATTPAEQSCARYFSLATPKAAVQCDIEVTWTSPWSLLVEMPGLLRWEVEMGATRTTRLISALGPKLPAAAWSRPALRVLGPVAGAALGAGALRLTGTAPNGQEFRVAPTQVWQVTRSRAILDGHTLARATTLDEQLRLGDFRLPTRGLAVVGHGRFDTFDPVRHSPATLTGSACPSPG